MLVEAMMALAAAGGGAVVQAAGTDVWEALRGRVARLFGRGEVEREHAELERLDRTRAALEAADGDEVERARVRQEAVWQTRFEALLENLPEPERDAAALELQALIDEVSGSPTGVGAQAGDGGLAVAGGDVHVQAEGGSIAGGVNNFGGEVTLGTRPSQPERERP